jgi:hypothetical protein
VIANESETLSPIFRGGSTRIKKCKDSIDVHEPQTFPEGNRACNADSVAVQAKRFEKCVVPAKRFLKKYTASGVTAKNRVIAKGTFDNITG